MSNLKPSRPRGVTIVGYVFYVGGILGLIVGVLAIISTGLMLVSGITLPEDISPIDPDWMLGVFGGIIAILGSFYLKAGRGLLKLKENARKTAVILVLISLTITITITIVWILLHPSSQAVETVVSETIYAAIEVAISIIIIIYLRKSTVKRYFSTIS